MTDRKATEAEMKISADMQHIAGALDHLLQKLAGKRMGFVLFTFEFNRLGFANYVTNGDPNDVKNTVRECVQAMERGPTPAIHLRSTLS